MRKFKFNIIISEMIVLFGQEKVLFNSTITR